MPMAQSPRVLTHLAGADEEDGRCTPLSSWRRLRPLLQGLRRWNSALPIPPLFCAQPATHADWVRPGLALYGISPFASAVGADFVAPAAMDAPRAP